MRKLYSILLCLPMLLLQSHAPVVRASVHDTQILGLLNPGITTTHPILFVSIAESNSGGEALNSAALSTELGPQPSIKIFNNTTNVMESLNIGVNNLLEHLGVSEAPTNGNVLMHGLELQLANRAKAGTITDRGAPITLIKSGAGGTRAFHWAVGATFTVGSTTISPWTVFTQRMDSCVQLLTAQYGGISGIYVFYTQGINDGTGGATTTWEGYTEDLMTRIRTRYAHYSDNSKVVYVMTKFFAPYNVFDGSIETICAYMGDCYWINGGDCDFYSVGNPHWTYSGFKVLTNRFVDTLRAHYSL